MKPSFLLCFLLTSVFVVSQQSPASCPADEKTIRALANEIWQSRVRGGAAGAMKYYSDGAVVSADNGMRFTKSQFFADMKHQDSGNDTVMVGTPEDIFVKIVDGIPILNFIDKMHNTDRAVGVEYNGTFRESRVFACENGEWKIVFRSEIQRPNAARQPVAIDPAKLEEYTGHYRMTQNGKLLGDVIVTRDGNKLLEAWGKQPPDEILPGGHDTFFVRNDNTVEQFLRDEHGKIVGIHYIFWDDHIEAQRVN